MADTSWIKKKERSNKWITKKKKPKSWITKKEEPKEWITKKKNWITKKPPNADLRKRLTDALAGGVRGKPHSSPSGQAASAGRTIKRISESRQRNYKKKEPRNLRVGRMPIGTDKRNPWSGDLKKEGGRAGFKSGESVTRFRSSGPEGKPHSTKEGRSAEAQRAYMRKFGQQEPRRKRLQREHQLRTTKATGGRIGLQHGNRPRPQGPHTWVKSGGAVLKGKKVGIQIK